MAMNNKRNIEYDEIKRNVEQKTASVAHFLKDFLPFANVHNCDLITENLWEKHLPPNLASQLESLNDKELLELLAPDKELVPKHASHTCDICTGTCLRLSCGCAAENSIRPSWDKSLLSNWKDDDLSEFLHLAQSHTLPNLGVLSTLDEVFQSLPGSVMQNETTKKGNNQSHVTHALGEKKQHEVPLMVDVCARLAQNFGLSQVVDVGSGRGYLGAHLSLAHGLQVLGIDSSSSNTDSATERSAKLSNLWLHLVRQAEQKQEPGNDAAPSGRKAKRRARKKQILDAKESSKHSKDKHDDLASSAAKQNDKVNGCETNLESPVISNREANDSDVAENASANITSVCENIEQRIDNVKLSSPETNPRPLVSELLLEGTDKSSSAERIDSKENNTIEQKKPHISITQFVNENTDIEALVREYFGKECVACCPSEESKTYKDKPDENPSVNDCDTNPTSKIANNSNQNCTDDIAIDKEKDRGSEEGATYNSRDDVTQSRVLLTGLHTCGDLAASVMRIYTASDTVRAVCGVGCCYHLMMEHYLSTPMDPTDHTLTPGFPLSSILRSRHAQLGRNARMLACQAIDRLANKTGPRSLYWRALLQVILRDLTGEIRDDWRVGRLATKCDNFETYVTRALKKLDIQKEITSAKIRDYEQQYAHYERRMTLFFQLRAALAPVIETLILLDRLVYLLEQDCTHSAYLVRLFDPVLSPRCYALIALKQ